MLRHHLRCAHELLSLEAAGRGRFALMTVFDAVHETNLGSLGIITERQDKGLAVNAVAVGDTTRVLVASLGSLAFSGLADNTSAGAASGNLALARFSGFAFNAFLLQTLI